MAKCSGKKSAKKKPKMYILANHYPSRKKENVTGKKK
jgi:hypothetical protein